MRRSRLIFSTILLAGLFIALVWSFSRERSVMSLNANSAPPEPGEAKSKSTPHDEKAVSNEKLEDHAPVELSLKQQQLIGVELGTVEKKPVSKEIYAPGRVAHEPELFTAQSEYRQALEQYRQARRSNVRELRENAKALLEAARTRLRILGLSDQQIKELEQGGEGDTDLLLTTPGQSAWIYAEIYEIDLPHVRPGMKARVRSSGLGESVLTGEIASVDNVLNPETRTATARIRVKNPENGLKPNSYVKVSIDSPLGTELVVPFYSILDTGKEAWVFVAQGDGAFEPRLVQVESYAGDFAIISDGLKEGERIVTSANFLLDSESRLRAAFTRGAKDAPECPEGQFWDTSMNMCMPGQLGGEAGEEKDSGEQEEAKPDTPECPEGQSWHASMNMCM